MIQTTHCAAVDERYIAAMELNPETCIYFDIETTGLKAETSHLYLIGYAVQKKPGSWEITQLFAEKTEDERYLLKAFSDICMQICVIDHLCQLFFCHIRLYLHIVVTKYTNTTILYYNYNE